jgi:hypothetical protein
VTGIAALPPAKLAAHEAAVARLRDAYAAVPAGAQAGRIQGRIQRRAQAGHPGRAGRAASGRRR